METGKSRENDLFPLLEEEKEKRRRKKVRERESERASERARREKPSSLTTSCAESERVGRGAEGAEGAEGARECGGAFCG